MGVALRPELDPCRRPSAIGLRSGLKLPALPRVHPHARSARSAHSTCSRPPQSRAGLPLLITIPLLHVLLLAASNLSRAPSSRTLHATHAVHFPSPPVTIYPACRVSHGYKDVCASAPDVRSSTAKGAGCAAPWLPCLAGQEDPRPRKTGRRGAGVLGVCAQPGREGPEGCAARRGVTLGPGIVVVAERSLGCPPV
ncbi:hypothetical protein PMIN01_01670 [Paraphaeosphaeria minitans]|uniref:Uncharacterized protein n=1 Tax=Paraphaeosphaeria minitans TaxID=565426 RepID=A0A9P6GPI7_9PLEO|nr:hypothetical protein PMIN01_01670 [Paraphaeosphaeria minitans]